MSAPRTRIPGGIAARAGAGLTGLALAAGLTLIAGCTSRPSTSTFRDSSVPAGSLRLVAFDSCDDALGMLKQAASQYVGPWGFGGGPAVTFALEGGGVARDDLGEAPRVPPAAAERAPAAGKAGAPRLPGQGPEYSGTNTHEAGVDEPDLVKTDGRRILTVSQGVLRVVDAADRRMTGQLDLYDDSRDAVRWADVDMLLSGDRALVLVPGGHYAVPLPMPVPERGGVLRDSDVPMPMPQWPTGSRLLLVDLAGGVPRLAGEYTIDGELIDARQVGATVRVVVRSAPRLAFPYDDKKTDAERIAANRAVIDAAGPDDWLPRYQVTAGGTTTKGRVDCGAVFRPATYTGASMLTVLTFDLTSPALGTGDPVTVVADGDTVYSNGSSLYVANDQRWRAVPLRGRPAVVPDQRTELYKFDISGTGRPRYVAAGSVPGWLINQYAMSEWDGHLRVATTVDQPSRGEPRSESTVYVLRQRGGTLVETGRVGGLGKGERIYAVRFVGSVGYVVTFRQTDPLYTVDLRDPAAPRVVGELKITGYSAYLHPAGDDRLIGVGQEATEQGRVQGTQVSLFDVGDLAHPSRLAQYHVRYGHSEAEFDPHAFLYWPSTGLLVVPLGTRAGPGSEALVLRVTDRELVEVGTVRHPEARDGGMPGQIRRSLVIGDVLWTVSAAGLKANDAVTLRTLAWIPFTR
jgi:hypothetical protein